MFLDETKVKDNEKDFFQEVFESTKKVITKENVEQNRKKRQEAFEEMISLAQCQVTTLSHLFIYEYIKKKF